MDNQLLDGFYLEGWLVEPVTGQYTSSARSGHLSSRAVEVLLCLAKTPRRLVPREELLAKVWGDGNGSAEALSHAIGDLRHAFGDNAANPSYIQTVPRRGYRLLVEPRPKSGETTTDIQALVTPVTSTQASKQQSFWQSMIRHGVVQASVAYLVFGWLLIQVADATFDNLGFPSWSVLFVTYVVVGGFPLVVLLSWFLELAEGRMVRDYGEQASGWLKGLERNYLAIIAAYGLAIIGVGAYHGLVGFQGHGQPQVASSEPADDVLIPVDENSVAVLKFINLDGSPTTNIFSEGLSEDILDRLARLPGLRVSSRGDSWSLPENASSDVVRRRLRVAYFLEGSVRLVGDELRVVAQLINSDNGYHIVSRSFNKKLNDYMDVQQELANLIVANLQSAMPDQDKYSATLQADRTDVDAYILYRRGVSELRLPPTVDTKQQAIAYFEQALAIDNGFAAAHAGICQAYIGLYELRQFIDDVDAARQACARASGSGGQMSVVDDALGQLALLTGNIGDAAEAFSKALQSNSQDVRAMQGLAAVYLRQQKFEEHERLLEKAIDLQPGNWNVINQLGNSYFMRGHYDEAAEQYQRVLYLQPDNFAVLSNLGSAQIQSGDFKAARETIEASLLLEENDVGYSNLGVVYYFLGEFDKSVAMHRKAVSQSANSPIGWSNLADALYFDGKPEEATNAYARSAKLLRRHLGVNPSDAEAWYTLAWAEARLGNIAEASQLIARAVDTLPDDPYAHYYDGLIKTLIGDPQGAEAAIRRAAQLGYSKPTLAADPSLKDLQLASDYANWLQEPAG